MNCCKVEACSASHQSLEFVGRFEVLELLQGNACSAVGTEKPGAAAGPYHAQLHGGALLPQLLLLLPLAAHPLQKRICI